MTLRTNFPMTDAVFFSPDNRAIVQVQQVSAPDTY